MKSRLPASALLAAVGALAAVGMAGGPQYTFTTPQPRKEPPRPIERPPQGTREAERRRKQMARNAAKQAARAALSKASHD